VEPGEEGFGDRHLLAYDLFLRTGEWTNLRLEAVEAGVSAATISLGLTKGVQRRGGVETVTCRDPLLVRHLSLLKATRGGGKLVEDPEAAIRVWLRKLAKLLGIADRKLTPYSFRRGGLSAASLDGVPVSTLALRARWLDTRIATVYIQEGEQTLRALNTPAGVIAKLQAAAKLLFH
jgi:integrase